MDMQSRRQTFPQLVAREKAHSLERFNRLVRHAPAAKVWRSWGDVAGYATKRMTLLSARAARPLEKVEHRSMWFATVRQNVARMGRDAYQNPWKRTIDISIRRFRELQETTCENQLWMAVALIETSRLAKRTGKRKAILRGWSACFTRNRFRMIYNINTRSIRTNWSLSVLRNTKLRFQVGTKIVPSGLPW